MFAVFLVPLEHTVVIGNISSLHYCQFGTEAQPPPKDVTHDWQPSPPAAAAEVFPGAGYKSLARVCSWMLVSVPVAFWMRRQEAGSLSLVLAGHLRFFFLDSPQTHHPEKPLFPTTGSPREHYR